MKKFHLTMFAFFMSYVGYTTQVQAIPNPIIAVKFISDLAAISIEGTNCVALNALNETGSNANRSSSPDDQAKLDELPYSTVIGLNIGGIVLNALGLAASSLTAISAIVDKVANDVECHRDCCVPTLTTKFIISSAFSFVTIILNGVQVGSLGSFISSYGTMPSVFNNQLVTVSILSALQLAANLVSVPLFFRFLLKRPSSAAPSSSSPLIINGGKSSV